MRILKTLALHKWASKERVSDNRLKDAVQEIEQGLVDADLGGHVFKKRVALSGRGKSGGARTLLAYNKDDRTFFMYGFVKNQRANIKPDELKALKLLAEQLLSLNNQALDKAIKAGELIEVKHDG